MLPMKAVAFCFAVLTAGWLACWVAQPNAVSDFPQYYAPAKLIVGGHGAQAYDVKTIVEVQHQSFPGMGERFVLAFLPPPPPTDAESPPEGTRDGTCWQAGGEDSSRHGSRDSYH